MPEIDIIIKHEVSCPQFSFIAVILSLCRQCPNYRYETVNRKVLCNFVGGPKPVPPKGYNYQIDRLNVGYDLDASKSHKEINLDELEKLLEDYD